MIYATLMIYLDPGKCNESLLRTAASVAERFSASVIGITACQAPQILSGSEEEHFIGETGCDMRAMEDRFRSAMHNLTREIIWRSSILRSPVSEYIACEARSADLIMIGQDTSRDEFAELDVPDLVLRSGRPILSVSSYETGPNLTQALIAWKDTREARHAVANALPFLQKAESVTVVEVTSKEEWAAAQHRVNDVAGWLKRHDIAAEPCAALSAGNDLECLDAIAREKSAGLIVAGAYGHSRFREWMLGGVTRDFLLHRGRSFLTAH